MKTWMLPLALALFLGSCAGPQSGEDAAPQPTPSVSTSDDSDDTDDTGSTENSATDSDDDEDDGADGTGDDSDDN